MDDPRVTDEMVEAALDKWYPGEDWRKILGENLRADMRAVILAALDALPQAAPTPSPDALAVERANTAELVRAAREMLNDELVRAAREMLNELPRERVGLGWIRTNETITRVHAALAAFAGIDP